MKDGEVMMKWIPVKSSLVIIATNLGNLLTHMGKPNILRRFRSCVGLCIYVMFRTHGIITLGGINTITAFASMSTKKWDDLAKSIVKGR